jgi:hypothetical protein
LLNDFGDSITVMPYWWLSQPKPPPSVRPPATPVVELMPAAPGHGPMGDIEIGQSVALILDVEWRALVSTCIGSSFDTGR